MIDKDMKRKDLVEQAGISQYTIHKLLNNQNVTADMLEKICRTLDCTLDDICEILPEKTEK